MRDMFPGHYPLTPDEQERIWNSATVVLDTNVLLNPYRYSVELRDRFTKILSEIADRLWIPHQVAFEFHERRISIIQGQHNLARELDSGFEKAFNQAKAKLHEYKKNALLDVGNLESKLDNFYGDLKKEIQDGHSAALDRYALSPQEDPMLEKLANILIGHVGPEYTESELEDLKKAADERYEKEIPPGYKDAGKSGERQYGDYIIWRQILDYAKKQGVDVLLVTDDAKEDWWWRSSGMTLGPRPELRHEFITETDRIFYAYRSDKFISEMSSRSAAPLEDGLLTEVQNASKRTEKQTIDVDIEAATRKRVVSQQMELDKYIELRQNLNELEKKLSAIDGRLERLQLDERKLHSLLRDSSESMNLALEQATRLESQLAVVRKEKDVALEGLLTEQRHAAVSRLRKEQLEHDSIRERLTQIRDEIYHYHERRDHVRMTIAGLVAETRIYSGELFDNSSPNATGDIRI